MLQQEHGRKIINGKNWYDKQISWGGYIGVLIKKRVWAQKSTNQTETVEFWLLYRNRYFYNHAEQ